MLSLCAKVVLKVYKTTSNNNEQPFELQEVTIRAYPTALLFAQKVFYNRSAGKAQRSLFDFINSVAMCLAEFI